MLIYNLNASRYHRFNYSGIPALSRPISASAAGQSTNIIVERVDSETGQAGETREIESIVPEMHIAPHTVYEVAPGAMLSVGSRPDCWLFFISSQIDRI